MPSLFSLPNEVLHSIANNVDLTDIESFAASCKILAAFAKSKRDLHHQYKKQYSTIILAWDLPINARTSPENNAFLVLSNVCKNKSLALYPQHLKIVKLEHINKNDYTALQLESNSNNGVYSGAKLVDECKCEVLAKLAPYFDRLDSIHFLAKLQCGNSSAAISLLLIFLHRLERLTMTDDFEDCFSLNHTAEAVGRYEKVTSTTLAKQGPQALARLREVRLERGELLSEFRAYWLSEMFSAFEKIPTMQILSTGELVDGEFVPRVTHHIREKAYMRAKRRGWVDDYYHLDGYSVEEEENGGDAEEEEEEEEEGEEEEEEEEEEGEEEEEEEGEEDEAYNELWF